MRKTLSILASSTIAIGTCLPASLAFATPPDVGDQSGSGSTAMTMVWDNPTQEYGGTEDPNNPMEITDTEDPSYDPTAPGKNLSFKAPTAINFVAKANGTLMAPSHGNIHIDNYSAFGIHVSSMKIDQGQGWNIVADQAASSGKANAVWGTIGPSGEALNWASYVPEVNSTDPIPVSKPYAWNMSAYDGETSGGDQVVLDAAGNVANLNIDLSTTKTFGTIHWYLKKGNAEAPAAAPTLPTTSTFSSTSLNDLHEIGEYLVEEGSDNSDYLSLAKGLVGQTIDVALNEGQGTMTARLVSVDNTRGLTFEAVDILTNAAMNSSPTNSGGWAASALNTSMNSGTIYNTYFSNCALADKVRQVSNSSYSYGSDTNTSDDYYWIPSANNIYGAGWTNYYAGSSSYSDGTSDAQFDYYVGKTATTNHSDNNLIKNYNNSANVWWLRSANPADNGKFLIVHGGGGVAYYNADGSYGVVPCFCL